jgi:hypothetical protein
LSQQVAIKFVNVSRGIKFNRKPTIYLSFSKAIERHVIGFSKFIFLKIQGRLVKKLTLQYRQCTLPFVAKRLFEACRN